MSTVLGSLSEIATSLFQSLRLSYVVPAFIFWGLNAVFILPKLPNEISAFIKQIAKTFALEPVALISVLSLLSGYFFYVLNTSIIRWFEGYPWTSSLLIKWIADLKVEYHQWMRRKLHSEYLELDRKHRQLLKEYQEKEESLSVDDPMLEKHYLVFKDKESRLLIEKTWYVKKLQYLYPETKSPFLPTRLGNVIAAFEDYPNSRYEIDSVTLWPRFVPILSREKYSVYLEREKANLDFLIGLCTVLLLFGVEVFFVGLLFAADMTGWIIAIGFLLVASYCFYLTSITGALGWGNTVRVAFDLYRYELLGALRGLPPKDIEDERKIWRNLSSVYRDLKRLRPVPAFDYRTVQESLSKGAQSTKGENN